MNVVEMWHTGTEIKQNFLSFAVIFDHFEYVRKKLMLQFCITQIGHEETFCILHMRNEPWPLVPKFISTHSYCKLRRTHWCWFKVNGKKMHGMLCLARKQMQSKHFSYELVRLFACFFSFFTLSDTFNICVHILIYFDLFPFSVSSFFDSFLCIIMWSSSQRVIWKRCMSMFAFDFKPFIV